MTFVSQILAGLALKQPHLASSQIATIGIGIVPNLRSRITGVYGAGKEAGIDEWGDWIGVSGIWIYMVIVPPKS
jgi:hypothetical protein